MIPYAIFHFYYILDLNVFDAGIDGDAVMFQYQSVIITTLSKIT